MKEIMQILEKNFQGRETIKGLSINRLSQMTLVLDNSLFSQKDNF